MRPLGERPQYVKTLTVFFTDLVGHTEMMSRLGDDEGRKVLREHEQITRDVLKQHGGTEVKTMGDGFMASFGSATKAVECAVSLQRAFADRSGEPLSVRVGLNAGEPIEEDGDLFGATVILASRIAAEAEGGEILVTDTVRGLCSGKGFGFADRGEVIPKGFADPIRTFSVQWLEGASPATQSHRLPDVWVRRLTNDSGHEVEVVNRSHRDLVDVVVENHEPRPNGVDQFRRAVVPLLQARETKAVILKDEQHDYQVDTGYGVRVSWDSGSACFWTAQRKREAEFEWEREGSRRSGGGRQVSGSPLSLPSAPNAGLGDSITITPDDDGEWAWLRVDNNGPTGRFHVSIELLETGEKEHSYHPPWRDGNVLTIEIVKGDTATANIAQITPNPGDLVLQEHAHAAARGEAIVRFYTTANERGAFHKASPVPSIIRCRIAVFRVDDGPVAPSRKYELRIEAKDKLGFFESVEDPERDMESETGGDRPYVGEGVWHEVKWRGFRTKNGLIRVEGPLCIYDDVPLLYRTHTPDGSLVEDYQEVAPPKSHLYCPTCETRYYLGATERKTQRVGDSRKYAAWRLGGGRTPLERWFEKLGL